MKIRITPPQRISATIQLPASKSISNRALIINALAQGTHRLENLSDCDDTQVMILRHTGNTRHHRHRTDEATSHRHIGGCSS